MEANQWRRRGPDANKLSKVGINNCKEMKDQLIGELRSNTFSRALTQEGLRQLKCDAGRLQKQARLVVAWMRGAPELH